MKKGKMKEGICKKIRRISLFFGLCWLLFPCMVWAEPIHIKEPIHLEVQYGFGNYIKSHIAVPVRVKVVCEEESIVGKIQIQVPVQSEGNLNASIWMSDIEGRNNKEQCYIWEKEITLEAGQSLTEDFFIELPANHGYFMVCVMSKNKILISEEVVCDVTDQGSRLFMGVVSQAKEEIARLNGLEISKDAYHTNEVFLKTIALKSEDIYDNPLAFEQLDVLVVDKGTEFSKEQKEAIEIWQSRGGLYYEKEEESLVEAVSLLQKGEWAGPFDNIIRSIGQDSSKEESFDQIPLKEKIPIGRYIFIICLYLILIGPGLYWMLKGKREPYWLLGGVCAVSFLFIVIIYLIGRSINIGKPAICHKTLYEQGDSYRKESIDFSIQAYKMQDFAFVLDESYQILPKGLGMVGNKSVDTQRAETITFMQNTQQNKMLLENVSAYRQNCFYMERYTKLSEDEQITFQIRAEEESLQIYWDNPTPYCLKQVVVVMENRIAVIGEIKPYAHASVKEAKMYSYSNQGMLTLFQDLLDFSEYDFPEYEMENLMDTIKEQLEDQDYKKENAFVIGIVENESTTFSENVGFEVYGSALMKIDVEIEWEEEQIRWCPNLEVYGKVYKGKYQVDTNLLQSQQAIIDYPTSQIGKLLSLEFFSSDYDNLSYNLPFSGQIYLFNWQTDTFSEVLLWDTGRLDGLSEEYVSKMGILRIYYVADQWLFDTNSACVLPCIRVSGKVE